MSELEVRSQFRLQPANLQGAGDLELSFATKLLRSMCEVRDRAVDALGEIEAAHLMRRLADLRAATSIEDIIVGDPHRMEASEDLLLNVGENHQMRLRASHPTPPTQENGALDWARVTRVMIVELKPSE